MLVPLFPVPSTSQDSTSREQTKDPSCCNRDQRLDTPQLRLGAAKERKKLIMMFSVIYLAKKSRCSWNALKEVCVL